MKKKKNVTTTKKSEKGLTIVGLPGETEEQAMARTMMDPALQSAATIQLYANSPVDLDLGAMIDCLEKQNENIGDGSLERIEEMLLVQAHALDVIANNLFRKAGNADVLVKFDSYMKFGLRAQSQCRATMETLASIKNPKAYLKQTNIAHNQQINNRLGNEKAPNELLEKTDGERLDPGTPQETVRVDSDLATVEQVHRAKNGSG
jgi:hypothetical protein